MDEMVKSLFPCVCVCLSYTIMLLFWLKSDMKSFETKIENKIDSFTNEFRKEMASYKSEIANEIKDFHGRLCSLESRWNNDNHKPKTDP